MDLKILVHFYFQWNWFNILLFYYTRSTNLNYSYNWINKSQSQFNYNFRIEASGNELFTNILIVYTTQRINNVTYKYNQIIRKLFFAWIMNIIQKLYKREIKFFEIPAVFISFNNIIQINYLLWIQKLELHYRWCIKISYKCLMISLFL